MLTLHDLNQVANAIYRVEGGSHTHFPYGILSIHTQHPRQVCINTIAHAAREYHIVKCDRYFIYVLAERYCPKECDAQGNVNWSKNMIQILNL